MRVKSKIFFNTCLRSLKNEVFNKFSCISNNPLHAPPNFIDVRITIRCNLRCQQCPEWMWAPKEELSTDVWKRVILDIRKYIGSYFLRFYGGEPFCRSDLLELVNFCSRNDICSFITTNGTFLDKSMVTELAKNQIGLINISLDGMRLETHDKLRGVQGTYQKVMKAIECLQGKVPIQIDTTIMNDNLDEIIDLSQFAYKNKIPISFQGLMNFMKRDDPLGHCLFPKEPKKTSYIIDELIRRKRYNTSIVNSYIQLTHLKLYYQHPSNLRKKYCRAIYNNRLTIEQKGDVFICCWFKPIGNLVQNSLRDIWHSKIAAQIREEMKKCSTTSCLVMRCFMHESWRDKWFKGKRVFLTCSKVRSL